MDDIIIEFPPEQEGITWIKRKVKEIQLAIDNHDKQSNSIEHSISVKKNLEMNDDFKRYISEINLRLEKYKSAHSSQLRKQLEDDYKILCVNFEHLGKPQMMANCIKNLNAILRGKTKKIEKIKKQDKQKSVGISDRGIQIQERLSEIKSLIKQNLSTNEFLEIKNELMIYKEELTENISIFSKADNIPIKLSQIENYLNKLSQKIKSNNNLQSEEKDNIQVSNANTQSGQTQRGIEIQEELANLRDEVKRKDLNPIEKENLTNALIKLKKEITLEIDKFSKYDSIPIRLDQIENYLDKLKEKEEPVKKLSVPSPKEKEEDEKQDSSKKQKKQVIWKFGL